MAHVFLWPMCSDPNARATSRRPASTRSTARSLRWITQQNSALVEQNAAAAKALEQQSHAMDQRVSIFRVGDEGGGLRSHSGRSQQHAAVAAHRHPGSHTVGYILEGTYEVKIDDGPVRTLKSGEVFYEAPNALHAVSRNASTTQPLKYLVIQVSDPTKPATVQE
jgi:quercetin dioxygenase-like cupin family protein